MANKEIKNCCRLAAKPNKSRLERRPLKDLPAVTSSSAVVLTLSPASIGCGICSCGCEGLRQQETQAADANGVVTRLRALDGVNLSYLGISISRETRRSSESEESLKRV